MLFPQLQSKQDCYEDLGSITSDFNLINDEMKFGMIDNMYRRQGNEAKQLVSPFCIQHTSFESLDPLITFSGEETSGLESSFTSPSAAKVKITLITF